jgi:hypothetical protein
MHTSADCTVDSERQRGRSRIYLIQSETRLSLPSSHIRGAEEKRQLSAAGGSTREKNEKQTTGILLRRVQQSRNSRYKVDFMMLPSQQGQSSEEDAGVGEGDMLLGTYRKCEVG